ncbi:MAG: FKBP-type peptidyl-prolyl cis-trans isomerase [Candidatus Lokiarchaeota archaeon]|nr:FKBP-type peptidyl-prolyl cis-trans isomerase [Candidatus Lokiarchaeota archaeon]
MSFNLSDIKGLGKKEDTLKEAGIDTVEKLANAKVDDLSALKGIGKATAEKFIENAKSIMSETAKEDSTVATEQESIEEKEVEKALEELKILEQRKTKLQGKKVEEGDFVLVKLTGRTQKGTIFRVSSEEDAKKAGMFDEKKAEQGMYTPEFVIIGKPGFLNEGLTEIIKEMNYLEKKSVRIPPTKAYGKRDPQKIERMGIAKFRKVNEGKNPELGQEFMNKKGQRGVITNVVQGRVIIDYNHPLAGQSLDYNLEIIDKIEEFDEKIKYFMVNKGIPKENVSEFQVNYIKDEKTLEITIPKMFLFQNLTYVKFGLAMDLQTHMAEDIEDVKFIEVYEKIQIPEAPSDSVMQKVEDFNKEKEEDEAE